MAAAKPKREGLRVRIQKDGKGVLFLNDGLQNTDVVPKHIRVPVEYAVRQPWIQIHGATPVTRPGGTVKEPFSVVHTFIHANELVLCMQDRDYHYKIVGQPDKYNAAGKPSDKAGDPTDEVRWFYDADLVGG